MENPRPEDSIPVAKKARREEDLPIELVSLILLSLSVKTLCKFRCVCKPWLSLIFSPQFQQDHYNRCSNESPILLLAIKISSNVETDTTTLFLHTYNTMEAAPLDKFSIDISVPSKQHLDTPIQSCRGLLCLVFHDNIFLFNPSTQELMPLPPPPTPQSNHCTGFGYAASTEDFKVVRFLPGPLPAQVTHCQVFTLRTRRWRQAKSPPPFFVGTGCAPFVRGALHLLPSLYCMESYHRNIFAFNVETEEYKAIRLPEYYYSPDRLLNTILLTELGGSLCLTFGFITRLELWLLKDYDNVEWTRLCTIQTSNLVDYSIHCISRSNPVAVLGERILINVTRRNWTTELLCYDPEGRVATEKWGEDCLAAYYVESFFSLGTRSLYDHDDWCSL